MPKIDCKDIVSYRLNYRIDRNNAKKYTIEEFISKNKQVLKPLYKKFAKAWNSIVILTLLIKLLNFLLLQKKLGPVLILQMQRNQEYA